MEITVGKYTIHSDARCMWITKSVKTQKKSNTKHEETDLKVAGYVNTIDSLYEDFVANAYRGSDARNVEKVLKDIDSAAKAAVKLIKAARKYDDGKRYAEKER